MKLHLCCGDIYLTEHINIDIDGTLVEKIAPDGATTLEHYYKGRMIGNKSQTFVDMKMNLLDIPWRFADNAIEEVVMIQGIEHFYCQDAIKIVAEIRRILKDGGKFLVDFPDIRATVNRHIDTNPEFCVRCIYCNHKNRYSIHHWGYTEKTFKDLLGDGWKIEFKEIVKHEYPAIGCIAIKKEKHT